jgi:hypothetical protein
LSFGFFFLFCQFFLFSRHPLSKQTTKTRQKERIKEMSKEIHTTERHETIHEPSVVTVEPEKKHGVMDSIKETTGKVLQKGHEVKEDLKARAAHATHKDEASHGHVLSNPSTDAAAEQSSIKHSSHTSGTESSHHTTEEHRSRTGDHKVESSHHTDPFNKESRHFEEHRENHPTTMGMTGTTLGTASNIPGSSPPPPLSGESHRVEEHKTHQSSITPGHVA